MLYWISVSDPSLDKAALLAEAEAFFNQLQNQQATPTEAKTERWASPAEETKKKHLAGA